MAGRRLRALMLLAALSTAAMGVAGAATSPPSAIHRADVDESHYPWSAIGKLYNISGSACSGVVIASNQILTAAHCLFNYRTRRFTAPAFLHFLVGYRTGHYRAEAHVQSYEIGPGFDPLRYAQTTASDWAVLTLTKDLPPRIARLRLSSVISARGTRAAIAGYPQDRAHALTADRNCELREAIDGGRLFLHTCRGISGYSGAPILVSGGGHDVEIAGIQIASIRRDGLEQMIAVPAQSIQLQAPQGPKGVPLMIKDIKAGLAELAGAASSWDEAGFADDRIASVSPIQDLTPTGDYASLEGTAAAIAIP